MKFKGDTGLFRAALLCAGFFDESEDPIFNDNTKAADKTGPRRLKLWFAAEVVAAPLAQQEALVRELCERFGDRLLKVYSVPRVWRPFPGVSRSLCIKLKD